MKNNIFKIFFSVILLASILSELQAQLSINEIFITNGSEDLNTVTYNYNDWVEVFNSSGNPVNTSGLFLSDDSFELKKYPLENINIPVGGYAAFYLTGHFKADADKGIITLSTNNGTILDILHYPKQQYDISYGRVPNGNGVFRYLARATINSANSDSLESSHPAKVKFNHLGGFYNGSISLEMINTSEKGNIYYSIDGTEPDVNSLPYSGLINITENTVIRARIIEQNHIPGNISTQSYFINARKPQLPVISIVTDPKNFFDNTIGIYIEGTNGIITNCGNKPYNWNQDWERSANFELLDTSNEQVVNQMIGIKIAGNCTRNFPQKSLSVNARSKYGKDKIDYKFFKNRNFSNYNSLYLRTGANDWYEAFCRDIIIQKLSAHYMTLDHQESQPAVIYINGEYYGIQHLYERSNEDLIESIYRIKSDLIDFGENNAVPVNGSVTDFRNLLDFVNENSLSVAENYNYVASQIDIDNFIDYNIMEIYVDNTDWPGNNHRFWRKRAPGSKWRWILYDTDFGLGLYNDATHNTLANMLGGSVNPEWSTRLFRKLLENPGFKSRFINRFYMHINTTFKPESVIQTIDSITSIFANEIPFHLTKWNRQNNWEGFVQLLRDYAVQRPEIMRSLLRDLLGAGENITLQFQNIHPGYGYISIEGVMAKDTAFNAIFPKGTVVHVNFIPATGYKFVKASRIANNIENEISSSSFTDTLSDNIIYRVYYENIIQKYNLVINEVAPRNTTYPDEFNENNDWIEIYNNSQDTITLSGLYITDSLADPTKFQIPTQDGKPVMLLPNQYQLLWADEQAHQGALHLNFKIKAGGEQIGIFQKLGEETVTLDSYSFGGIFNNESYGRIPNISGSFKSLKKASPLAGNNDNPTIISKTKDQQFVIRYIANRKILEIIDKESTDPKHMKIIDITGRIMQTRILKNSIENIDVSGLKKGLYIVNLQNNEETHSEKFLIY